MRRRLSLAVAFVGVLGLIGLAPAAQAEHDNVTVTGIHENAPTPPAVPQPVEGACGVLGDVAIGDSDGLGDGVEVMAKNHNHYRFVGVEINCEFVDGAHAAFNGGYDVDAAGGTDGTWNDAMTEHGEDTAEGWSHGSCYDDGTKVDPDPDPDCVPPATNDKGFGLDDLYDGTNTNEDTDGDGVPDQCTNCGEIEVVHETPGGPASTASAAGTSPNVVMFYRQESVVEAWGALHINGTASILCFYAPLNFFPTNGNGNPAGDGSPAGLGKGFDVATLFGVADVWFTTVKADCGTHQTGGKK